MWSQVLIVVALFTVAISDTTAPGFVRSTNKGVKSLGFKVLYGDEDINEINQVVSDIEKSDLLKSEIDLNAALPPLPSEDVKCLMSVDRHCSQEMGEIKSVLIQALKEDCKTCTSDQKAKAGKIVASMMAHDPVAWKTFLTRSALLIIPPRKVPKQQSFQYQTIGEPEEVKSSNRYMKEGFSVRVKRYAAKIESKP